MAKFELKFIDYWRDNDHIKCEKVDEVIAISGYFSGEYFEIDLDKSTAIKFAKTLRTEINKITEEEDQDGNR